jgi:hypothetical protein
MLPLWGSVELLTEDRRATDCLADLRARSTELPLQTRVTALQSKVKRRLSQDRRGVCIDERALPDARIVVELSLNLMACTPPLTRQRTQPYSASRPPVTVTHSLPP